MKYVMIALTLAAVSLTSLTASAQTRRDYQRYNHTGYGQCATDDGYGRYHDCDSGG
jgi:hypothetical protein